MIPVKYDFKPHVEGDTSEAVEFTIDKILTGAAIKIQFRDVSTKKVALTLEVGDGIEITDADGDPATFRVTHGAMTPLNCGEYYYTMQITWCHFAPAGLFHVYVPAVSYSSICGAGTVASSPGGPCKSVPAPHAPAVLGPYIWKATVSI